MGAIDVTVQGRAFLITTDGTVVDCRDVATGYESQAIVGGVAPGHLWEALANTQVRDAIASAFYNATAKESGQYPVGGTALADDFEVTRA